MNDIPKNISPTTQEKLQIFITTLTMLGLKYTTKLQIAYETQQIYLELSIYSGTYIYNIKFIFKKTYPILEEIKAQSYICTRDHIETIAIGKTFDEIIQITIEYLSKIEVTYENSSR